MKLYDMKAGMNPRRVRIFLAEKGLSIPRVEVDMAGGENRRMEFEIMRPIQEAFGHLSPFWVGKREQIAQYGELAKKTALERMAWLDGELATRPFIAGERYTVADITAQCACVLGKNTGTPIPDTLSHLTRWFSDVSSRPTARA